MKRGPAGALAALSATVGFASCANVLGIQDRGGSVDDLCACAAVARADLHAGCEALAKRRDGDVAFLQTFVGKGCPDCAALPKCLDLLGAAADGAACAGDAECSSTHCCASKTCCATCFACSSSKAPHCSRLFDAAAKCLLAAHGGDCGTACASGGPAVLGDACWSCLVGAEMTAQKCQAEIDACNAEVQ